MGWIFATVVLLLVVFVPVLRKIAFVLIAILVVTVWINYADDNNKRKEKEATDAAISAAWAERQSENEKAKIFPLSDVNLSEAKLSLENGGNFSGRIYNRSKNSGLGSVSLKLSISDCEMSDETNCVVIAERDMNVIATVPSGQARDFTNRLDFFTSPIVIRGYMKIDTKLVRASQ